MAKAHQFKNEAEAYRIMGALHVAGKVHTWTPVVAFGRVTANVWMGAGWLKLTEAKFASLVAA
jgi:hypothetical protein